MKFNKNGSWMIIKEKVLVGIDDKTVEIKPMGCGESWWLKSRWMQSLELCLGTNMLFF